MAVAGLGPGDMLRMTWPSFDTLDIDTEMASSERHNEVTALMRAALLARTDGNFIPQVLLHGIPSGNTDDTIGLRIARPKSSQEFQVDIARVTGEGSLPQSYRAYLITPSPEFFEKLSVEAYRLVQDQNISVEKRNRDIKRFAKQEMDRYILGVTEYRAASVPSATSHTLFRVTLNSATPAHWGGLSARGKNTLQPADKKALTHEISSTNREVDVRSAFTQWYYINAWEFFKQFTTSRNVVAGPWSVIHRALNAPDVRTHFDKAQGKDIAKPPEVPGEIRHSAPSDSSTFVPPHGVNLSKVIPSIRASGGRANDIVTANDEDRRWQRADGSYTRPNPIPDQRLHMMIPADKVAPLLRTGDYDVTFGIVYDHPLIFGKGRYGDRTGVDASKDQLWWYTNRNQFISSAYQYARLTGDHPHLVYRIIRRSGPKSGEYIGRNLFNKERNPGTVELDAEISKLLSSFKNAVRSGIQRYPALMKQRLGLNRADLIIPHDTNEHDVPKGLTPKAWVAYLRWLRQKVRTQLGLNLEASIPVEWVDIATGKRKKLGYSRHTIARDVALKRTVKFSGEKDEKGKPLEPWGIYLIQYILGHKADSSLAGQAFMVPINVVRTTKEDLEPRRSLRSVKESDLRRILQQYFGNLHFGKTAERWKFIRAHPNLPFPFARMVRPITVVDQQALDKINRKIHNPNIRRTVQGYVIDGIEFDAYVMLTSMPPSVAQEHFGLIHKEARARQIITNPDMVYRLRRTTRGKRVNVREFGLVNRRTKLETFVNKETGQESNPYSRHELQGIDQTAVLGKKYTDLPPGYYMSEIGKQWAPQINHVMDEVGRSVSRTVVAYALTNDPEQKKALYAQYAKEAYNQYPEVKNYVKQYLQALVRVSRKYDPRDENIMDNIATYIRYVKREVSPTTGAYYKVPALIQGIGLTEYHAPFSSVRGFTQMMKVKAPSEDVAKLLILYRLMRRSHKNKTVGKIMTMTKFNSTKKLFPDINARILAQWAKTGFIVIPERGGRTRFLRPASKMHAKDMRVQRAAEWGDHRFARMLRTD